jgi:hypothetical protein
MKGIWLFATGIILAINAQADEPVNDVFTRRITNADIFPGLMLRDFFFSN